jgi:pyruvate, water dikinase
LSADIDGLVLLNDALEEARFGGKCVSLGFALRAGLPAPSGYALAVDLVSSIVNGDAQAEEAVKAIFSELAPAVAVRSSAVGEDSADASFAGQHLTVLNVMDADSMLSAICHVHASAFTTEAIAYRAKMGVTGEPAIAVVIQQQILSEVAGVMFTKNPLSGADERYIEASWGLGEAVVAGMVVPDSFRVSSEGNILEQVLGDKDVELLALAHGETMEGEVDDARQSILCLSESQLEKLHNLAVNCEAVYGQHIDIEWAFHNDQLYLLQCRSITM